jgi:hypothetical protein
VQSFREKKELETYENAIISFADGEGDGIILSDGLTLNETDRESDNTAIYDGLSDANYGDDEDYMLSGAKLKDILGVKSYTMKRIKRLILKKTG